MPFDYESLVGHLYVVGGRALSATPPGALVEVAPHKAVRGRELDTFFALVLASGDSIAPTAFYEQMAQLAVEKYFESTGSVTAGMREVFNHLNENLVEHNESGTGRQYEASMLCGVLRGDDLIIGRVGAGVVLLRHEGEIRSLPTDLTNDEALFNPPLGVQKNADIKMSRHKVANGTRLVFADVNMADLGIDDISQALAAEDLSAVLVAFKHLVPVQLTMLAVEFVPPELPAPIPVPEGESSVAVAEAVRTSISKRQAAEAAANQLRPRRNERGLGKTGEKLVENTQRGLGVAANGLAQGMELTTKTIEHYFAEKENSRRRFSTPVATGLVVLIPVIIVALVVTLWVSSTGTSEFEQCLNNAVEQQEFARSQPSGEPERLLAAWQVAVQSAQQCSTLRPDDQTVLQIIDEGRRVSDELNDIERREATAMQSIEGALFDRIRLDGNDLYVLDRTRDLVYQAILSDDGRESGRLDVIPDIRGGESIDGLQITEIFDIAFFRDSLYAISQNGVLVACRRRLEGTCRAEQLITDNWSEAPAAITFYGENLYVLDPGANQVWRYEPSPNGQYNLAPTDVFAGRDLVDNIITTAVDFAIDNAGSVFVLLADGQIAQYNGGQRLDFNYGGFPPGQEMTGAQSLFLDDNPLALSIYMTDAERRTIFEVGKSGSFRSAYRITEEDMFATLAGVVAIENLKMIYAISGNTIFAVEM